jgi:5-methylthioadenosine/S-adenosylhomocysteine deaminase
MADGKTTRIKARLIIAYDGTEHRLLRDGCVVYRDDTIVHVGPSYEGPVDVDVDAGSDLVAPGFVSIHSHLSNSPLTKSFREDSGNPQFWMSQLYEFLGPSFKATTLDMGRASILASFLELLRSGVTTVVDLTDHDPEETAQMAADVGLRAYVAPYIRSASWRVQDGREVHYDWLTEREEADLFDRAVQFVVDHDDSHGGLIKSLIAPAQLDTCREPLLLRAFAAAEEHEVPISIHAGQAVLEFHAIVQRTGKTPIGYLNALGLLDPRLILAHCVFVGGHSWLAYPDDGDLALLADSGAAVAHCPIVFSRYGIALESLPRYVAAGVSMGLGNDTFPQSMLFEMRAAALAAKFVERTPLVGTARDVFDLATIGGADALGRPDLGRLTAGAKADIVCYRTDTVSMAPLRDPLRNLVFSALPSDVARVIINGREVLKDGLVPSLDEGDIAAGIQQAGEELWGAWQKFDWSGRPIDELSPPSLRPWVAPDPAATQVEPLGTTS